MNKNYWIEIVLDIKVFHLCMLCTHWIHQPIPKLWILNFPYILDFIYGWYWNTNLNSIFLFGCHRSTKKKSESVLTSWKNEVSLQSFNKLQEVFNFQSFKKEDFGPRGHLSDYLPTLRGQSWTFDWPPTYLIFST